jgi:FixJ family two-component response regulator
MSSRSTTLFIVDDDPQICRALGRLLRGAGYHTRSFGSATEFLVGHQPEQAGCLILDMALPGVSGLELQRLLAEAGCRRPIIFLSGWADIPKTVRAMKAGAVNFLTKPVDQQDLLEAVEEALAIDAAARADWSARNAVAERLATLTPRERQVFQQVVAGRLNKQIAAQLGIVEKTIKVHRARVMHKMGAGSVAELVQIAQLAGIDLRSTSMLEAGVSRH